MKLLDRLDQLDARTTRRPVARVVACLVAALGFGVSVAQSAADGNWTRSILMAAVGIVVVSAIIVATRRTPTTR